MYQLKKLALTIMIMVTLWAGNNLIASANDENLLESGHDAIAIGWGCPLKAPIDNIGDAFGNDLLGYINFFIPVSEMVGILTGWLIAIGAYYIASVALRWARAIS